MINNRQGGRRRGRGGQRGPNPGGQPGNRQDNRQRGNAAQLLEKYKAMARDSQLAGDRVQTEYYLQYADHYFRLLSETRSRFEDQRRQRGDDMDDDSDDGELESADAGDFDSAEEPAERVARTERAERPERSTRPERPRRDEEEERPTPRSRRGAERPDRADRGNGGETIPFDALPPAIGADDNSRDNESASDGDGEEPRRPTSMPTAISSAAGC